MHSRPWAEDPDWRERYRRSVNPHRVEQFDALEWNEDFVRAQGCELIDAEGRVFLDMMAGFGAAAVGHHHPAVDRALGDVLAASLPHTLPAGVPRGVGALAEALCERAGGALRKVYFGNSGAEGIEAALKFAMAHTGRGQFLCFEGGYHGLTLGALSVMGGGAWRVPFPYLPVRAHVVGFEDLDAVERTLAGGEVAAVVLEVVQGLNGARTWSPERLRRLDELCHQAGALLIVDEVLTGIGRTGRWFAFQAAGEAVRPDLVVVSKGLTGGAVPVCAVLMTEDVFRGVFSVPGRGSIHGSTFSGNLLAMAAGLSVLRIIEEEGLLDRATRMGERLTRGLEQLQRDGIAVREVRGQGLLVGVRIVGVHSPDDSVGAFACCQGLRDLGVITTLAGHAPAFLKLTPPLTITEAQIDFFLERFREVGLELEALRAEHAAEAAAG
jgi:acetylornithine/succinyldiaminopimelate/putrescine aminotransferase